MHACADGHVGGLRAQTTAGRQCSCRTLPSMRVSLCRLNTSSARPPTRSAVRPHPQRQLPAWTGRTSADHPAGPCRCWMRARSRHQLGKCCSAFAQHCLHAPSAEQPHPLLEGRDRRQPSRAHQVLQQRATSAMPPVLAGMVHLPFLPSLINERRSRRPCPWTMCPTL